MDFEHGITAIDTGFFRPRFDASHLLIEDGRAAFIDVGTNYSVPLLLDVLKRKGIAREAVDWVILTHVHLDHAGGAGAMMRELPNARLVVHPRGAQHMIDPAKLIAGATAVYGADEVQRSYGELLPVPIERVIEAPEGFKFALADRELLCLDTPGHARHHLCVYDARSRSFFTGDTFGISYREFDSERGAFILPTSTPVQFDPDALRHSIRRLLSFEPEAMFLTHYSRVADLPRLADDLVEQIDAMVGIARMSDGRVDRHRRLCDELARLYAGRAREHGSPLSLDQVLELLAMDIELNAQGLGVWLDRAKAA